MAAFEAPGKASVEAPVGALVEALSEVLATEAGADSVVAGVELAMAS